MGANFIAREVKADHIERNGQFITGQNPALSVSLARAVISSLKKELPPLPNTVNAQPFPPSCLAIFPVGTFIENIAVAKTDDIRISNLAEGKVYQVGRTGQGTEIAAVEQAASLPFAKSGALIVSTSIASTELTALSKERLNSLFLARSCLP
ncbi:hypothetical protein ACPOL_4839 [Acidisarcina polymorpha]|uniref:Uncharacterized protein n=1 Tax=Acidisarcina polymorpha TaxID=2211140 RepID=A0A2Z5G4V2_9BACT|nr:hypothetical protein [Acidisarcina polymorpha]AXC14101.1 hypothetical protein ACPOL_4839 [Acidisarcina polymorpha]